jgi:nitrile hydratase accessory protein
MTTLTLTKPFGELPGLLRDSDGPVFAEPWQAQAFALAVQLNRSGCFSWPEWADALAAVLREAAEGASPDDGARYYDHWLVALEWLCIAKGLTDALALDARTADWADAYRRTPHGRPVELPAAAEAKPDEEG